MPPATKALLDSKHFHRSPGRERTLGPGVHLYMIFVDFLGCIRNKLTLELCKIFKCDVSCCKLQIHMQGSKMALTNNWNSETRKPANLRRKRTRPHENPRFNFQCFDSFSDPSLRRTKWKMEFTITACRGCSLHMNSQSFPGERSSIKFSVAHHTSQEVNDDNEASTSAVCIRETKYNWTPLPFVTTSAQADCQTWLSSCKHLNVRLQFQKISQLYTPHLWKSDHEAVAREIKHLALQYEVGGIWRDRYIWHEQRPVQTPQQQQEVNGFKDGSMVTRYTLDVCSSTLQCKLRDGKKMTKHEKTRQGRLPGRLNRVPQRHEALAIWFATGIRFQPRLKKGLWSLKWYQNWSAIQMTWRCFYSLPICSHFKSTLIFMKLCYSSLHGDSCCFRKTFFRSTGQSEHNGPFASPGLAN